MKIGLLGCSFLLATLAFSTDAQSIPHVHDHVRNLIGVRRSMYNGLVYLYFDKRLNYTDSVQECQRYNGTLALIKSKDIQEHIEKNLFSSACKSTKDVVMLYIGLSDKEIEGIWKWEDGTRLRKGDFSNWMTGIGKCQNEPNGRKECHFADQDYAVIQSCEGPSFGKWFDMPLLRLRRFICQTKRTSLQMSQRNDTARSNRNYNTTVATVEVPRTYQQTTIPTSRNSSSNVNTTITTLPSSPSERPPTVQSSFTGNVTNDLSSLLQCMTSRLLRYRKEQKSNTQHVKCEAATTFSLVPAATNAIKLFEEDFAEKAASLMLTSQGRDSVNLSMAGMKVTLIPVNSVQRSKVKGVEVTFSDEGHSESVEIKAEDMQHIDGRIVLVGAHLQGEILEEGAVLETYSAENLDTHLSKYENNTWDVANLIPKTSSVISISVFTPNGKEDKNIKRVSIPVSMKINLNEGGSVRKVQEEAERKITEVSYQCVYLDLGLNKWSTLGCTTEVENQKVKCHCNHTTAFAVMVSIKSIKIPEWLETMILVMEILGIVFLFVTTLALLLLRKHLRKDRVLTQLNLTLSLLFAHLFFVVGSAVSASSKMCEAMTVFSHFFLMASAMWMLNEGLVLYKKTCGNALNFDITKLRRTLFAIGWGFPALYVMLCTGIGMGMQKYMDVTEGYRSVLEQSGYHAKDLDKTTKYDRCWLSTRSYMIFGAIIPIALALIANTFFLFCVARVIWFMSIQSSSMMPSDSKNSGDKKHIKATFKAVLLLLPILGIPWILAFFVNIPGAEIVFIGIHGTMSGVQGFLIFLIYTVTSTEFRTSFKRRLAKTSLSTSLNLSSTSSYQTQKTKRTDISNERPNSTKSVV